MALVYRNIWILVLCFLAESVFSQATPSGWTTNYRLRKYAAGVNPGADSLNQNWIDIDTEIYKRGWTYSGASKVFPTVAGWSTHFRTAAGDTTSSGIINVYGSSGNIFSVYGGDSVVVNINGSRKAYVNTTGLTVMDSIFGWAGVKFGNSSNAQGITLYAGSGAYRLTYPNAAPTDSAILVWDSGANAYEWIKRSTIMPSLGSMAYADSTTYHGSASINTLGTIGTGIWNGTVISTNYTEARIRQVTADTPLSIDDTDDSIHINISVGTMASADSTTYHGSASINTLGTIGTGVWAGSVISTNYTEARIRQVTAASPLSIDDTDDSIHVSISLGSMAYADSTKYHGSASINTLGTIGTGTWAAGIISTNYTEARIRQVTAASPLSIDDTDDSIHISITLGTIANNNDGLDTTISIVDGGDADTHTLTFVDGLLTSYTKGAPPSPSPLPEAMPISLRDDVDWNEVLSDLRVITGKSYFKKKPKGKINSFTNLITNKR